MSDWVGNPEDRGFRYPFGRNIPLVDLYVSLIFSLLDRRHTLYFTKNKGEMGPVKIIMIIIGFSSPEPKAHW